VADFLERGGTYRCVLVDPASPAATLIGRQRGEDLPAKIKESLETFGRFKAAQGGSADGLEISLTRTHPPMAALAVDLRQSQALLLYSPYLSPAGPEAAHLQRADMPHYLVARSAGPLFTNVSAAVLTTLSGATRVL
jgi:hypothetical protein